jgi:hypothetical protein
MDATGLRELIRQSKDAGLNRRNLAIVRGRAFISRLLAITAVDQVLVLVERPEDLIPPLSTPRPALPAGDPWGAT